jgi:hypothetical protein
MIPPARPTDLEPKRFQPFWVEQPDIVPAKVLFAKDELPDG